MWKRARASERQGESWEWERADGEGRIARKKEGANGEERGASERREWEKNSERRENRKREMRENEKSGFLNPFSSWAGR